MKTRNFWKFTAFLAILTVVLLGCPTPDEETTVKVVSVTLNKSKLNMNIGDEELLIYTIAPSNASNMNVEWISDDPEVASVTNGRITAKTAGSANITIKTQDGDKTDTCAVLITPESFIVTFNVNGADGTAPEAQTVNSGTVISLPGKGGMNKGADIFVGWNESSIGGDTTYSEGVSVTVTRNMVFYAQWLESSPLQYTVTFNANGATSGAPPASQTVYRGISITVPTQGTLEYIGKIFSGWNTQPNGEGTNYTVDAAYIVMGHVTLYAKWQSEVQYTVTYHANGASGTVPTARTVDPGTVITLPGMGGMTNSGKTFEGWNTSTDGNGINYNAGFSYAVTANVTLYAQWVVSTFPMRGSWVITGSQGLSNYNGSIFVVDEVNGKIFKGYFDWYLSRNSSATYYMGREYYSGEYDPELKKITMKGISLSNTQQITVGGTTTWLILGNYQAYIAENGRDIISGNWTNGGIWAAKKN
jgi:uncharacterized repeat protein (TIGR02543 family)